MHHHHPDPFQSKVLIGRAFATWYWYLISEVCQSSGLQASSDSSEKMWVIEFVWKTFCRKPELVSRNLLLSFKCWSTETKNSW